MQTAPFPSFEALYREQFAFVWRSLYRLGIREADILDSAQEVFLVAHRRLHEFEGRAKLTTWLFRICMNVASDHLRRAHVRREVLDEAKLEGEVSSGLDPEANRSRREGLALLDAALATMSLEHRTVFVLFELEGLTSTEIAETLELPVGTVHSRLRRGRQLFEAFVERVQHHPSPLVVREST
jgi:RNA polymerase sigma-70 factor, ECF subfamily